MWAWAGGEFVKDSEAVVSVHDRGFRYGDGVFDTLRVYRRQPFLIDRHIDRLLEGAAILGITPLPAPAAVVRLVRDLIDRNATPDALVRTTLTRGTSVGWEVSQPQSPTVVIVEQPFSGYPGRLYTDGAAIVILLDSRLHQPPLAPSVKTISRLHHVQAKREATARHADEAVLCAASGFVAEGTVSNVFGVTDGCVQTPPLSDGALQGVTRDVVLGLAGGLGIRAQECSLTPQALREADEVFLTSTGMEILPVTRIDGRWVGSGRPGPVTLTLRKRYLELIEAGGDGL